MNTNTTINEMKTFKIDVITTCVQRSVQEIVAKNETDAIDIVRNDIALDPEKYDNDDVIAYTHHVCNTETDDYSSVAIDTFDK